MFKTDKGVIIIIYGSIICLGDSLTAGSRDELWRGYPVELELLLWKHYKQNWNCVNAGIAGETSIDVYKRSYQVLRSYPEASDVVLLVGTNDAKVQIETPPERYEEHVEAILRCATRWDKVSYLCLIPDLRGFGAPDYCSQELINLYNIRLQALAKRWGEDRLVDLRRMPSEYYADGVHMNNAGYKEIAKRIAGVIKRNRHY